MLRKCVLWLAGVIAVLALLLVIFYAEEDWRGARDWAACQKELQAKGEILDLRQLVPPGKPEDDLSKVPIFAELNANSRGWELGLELDTANSRFVPTLASLTQSKPLNLAAWQIYYRTTPDSKLPYQLTPPAQDVLTVLNRFGPEVVKIDSAFSNPNAYWPINYEKPFDTSVRTIVNMTKLAKFLQLRAVAYLENHQPDLAEKDYLFSFRLNQPLIKGCFLINYLVMVADQTIDDSILWEGLHRHAWNDAQLREMESALASTDMLALAVDNFRTERAACLKTMDLAYSDHGLLRKAIESDNESMGYLFLTASIRPSGWWNQDRFVYSMGIQKKINAIDLNHGTLFSGAFPYHASADWDEETNVSIWDKIYIPLSVAALPIFDNIGLSIAHVETNRRLARLACRLEEYRIAHGQYPDALDDLPDLPAHLNQEVLSEQPLRYRRKGDGYLLYSTGWNQKDEGGLYSSDEKEGDWVWPSP